jgi:hypothetical protein
MRSGGWQPLRECGERSGWFLIDEGRLIMALNTDKIDDYTLALLYLVTGDREEGLGARAWKSFDWDTMNRLHEKGHISNPKGKAKSVVVTEEGFAKAKELFQKFFVEEPG